MNQAITIADRRELFLDHLLIERMENVTLKLHEPVSGGVAIAIDKPLIFSGSELELNCRTSAAGSVRVELQNADGRPLAGTGLADCPEIIGDDVARIVAWKQGADVSRYAGQAVRLRFVMKDADLYSFRFRRPGALVSPMRDIEE